MLPEIVREQLGLFLGEAVDAEEIDVRHRHGSRIPLPDRECRAGDGDGNAQLPARAAHERSLTGAEFAGDKHHVAGLEPEREPRSQRLGLGGAVRLEALEGLPGNGWKLENIPAQYHLMRL